MGLRIVFLAVITVAHLSAPTAFGQWAGSSTPGYVFFNGGVGIGTSTPSSSYFLDVASNYGARIFTNLPTGYGGMTVQGNNSAYGNLLTLGSGRADVYAGQAAANWTVFLSAGAESGGFILETYNSKPLVLGTNNQERIRIDALGRVGIGVSNPQYALDVSGDLNVTGNIAAKYQDVAEWVPTEQELDDATVVVLSTENPNHVEQSRSAYDTKVAGVVSPRPGLILGEAGADKTKVATTGRVKIKVDARKHPIAIGDLLVTSDTPGYAMLSTPVEVGGVQMHRPGTIIGKALEPLREGTGEILVLLSLQ